MFYIKLIVLLWQSYISVPAIRLPPQINDGMVYNSGHLVRFVNIFSGPDITTDVRNTEGPVCRGTFYLNI